MRLIIDMQGAQSESRYRGIGRYTMNLAHALIRNRGNHEIVLVLSGLMPDTIEMIRAAFQEKLSPDNLRVWHALGPVQASHLGNEDRRRFAEIAREAFIRDLQPDVVLVTSLFEGYGDNAVTSIGRLDSQTPVCAVLYDLIPLVNSEKYLTTNPLYAEYYREKLGHVKRAQHLLAISEFTRQEGIALLEKNALDITNISGAADSLFYQTGAHTESLNSARVKLGINRPFILYTGGADERKNLPRLLKAYARLPADIRSRLQLVLAGKMPTDSVAESQSLATDLGLGQGHLLFTGYLTDEELTVLYKSCHLYVFPSWHEGFGLPALEAMACGAPVIGSNTSSLPEVIGRQDALFDPFDVQAIAAKIEQALTDDAFRADLSAYGLARSKEFSWDATGRCAIAALQSIARPAAVEFFDYSLQQSRLYEALAQTLVKQQPAAVTLAAACIAQNQQSAYMRQLLIDVSELSQRDAATGVQRVVRNYLKWLLASPPSGYRVEPVFATPHEGYRYARNFTLRFLGQAVQEDLDTPMRWQRGDIFFGLDMQHHVQLAHHDFYKKLRLEGVVVKFLLFDLLPIQLADFFQDSKAAELHKKLLSVMANTDGVICISRATSDAYRDWLREHKIETTPGFQNDWVHIGADIEAVTTAKNFDVDFDTAVAKLKERTTFLCVSTLEPRKGQQQILDAIETLWRDGHDVNLAFVGQRGWKVESLVDRLNNHPERQKRLFWFEGIDDNRLEQVYAASQCLIAASINEGFGLSLIEGARYGLPIIARDIPVFREVAGDAAFYFSGDTTANLSTAIAQWLDLFRTNQYPDSGEIRWSTWAQSTDNLKKVLCEPRSRLKQLLVDVSELVQHDAKTGIQRVVRSVLSEWLNEPPKGVRVEPVYATADGPYRYARKFTSKFLGSATHLSIDAPIEFGPGDVFFALDYQPQVQIAQTDFYQYLRRQGVTVKFMLYDLLCVFLPSYFPSGSQDRHSAWLEVVAETDGAVCISRSVADEMTQWMNAKSFNRLSQFSLDWIHLGADIDNSSASEGLPQNWEPVIESLSSTPSFLMVGTLEPRKGHAQVLTAFERLWREGNLVNLVIVGKAGWMVDDLISRLKSHPERGRHLFWLEAVSDQYLEKVYAASRCLIAASFGEGFGLPLIEAAQHKLPIVARDIPVFREVAGNHAHYFAGDEPSSLVNSIQHWLSLFESDKHPKCDDMPWMTWKESVQQLNQKLFQTNKGYRTT